MLYLEIPVDRHSSWPLDFTPKPYYIRSKNSSTGFRGVSIDKDKKRRSTEYRVKFRNHTIARKSDLHSACEAFYLKKTEVQRQKKNSKSETKSKLDELNFD